ncbi:MAG: hypothetical protein ACLP7P_12710 [Rhodomicrobium sp.]
MAREPVRRDGRAPGVSVETIVAATEARLIVPAEVPEMRIAA